MKRFTDTDKWSDPWFRSLAPKFKLFWSYICDRCDNCGVWKPDFALASFCIGEQIHESDALATFQERVKILPSGCWWIKKFIRFQCGELNPQCRPHLSIFAQLRLHGIGYPYPTDTLQEKEEEKDQEEEKEKGMRKRRFPETQDDAITEAMTVGADPKFIKDLWNTAMSRNGYDGAGQPIASWRHYVAKHWPKEQEKRFKQKKQINNGQPNY